MNTYKRTLLWVLGAFLCGPSLLTAANTPTMAETKSKLQLLEHKMATLEQTLRVVNNRRDVLTQELEQTEKEISTTIRQLNQVQQNIKEKQQEIAVLKQLIQTLNHQLKTQRKLLAQHLRARYKMGEYQPLKWLLNQENPYAINRLLTFYQYILKARQNTINQVLDTQARLNDNQKKLSEETQQQQLLATQVRQRQDQLNQNKQYRAAVIQSLDTTIQSKKHTLEDYQKNKENLAQLITSLSQQGLTTRSYPLVSRRRHLPKPVQTSPSQIEQLNQGLTFYAPEGTTVAAVYPGKVVFSDWLKGYGLLLIIDHGAGYMTLYAHNQALFKQKGEFVDQGEKIATVGHSGGFKKSSLYFEVRHGGKTIPPMQWLS